MNDRLNFLHAVGRCWMRREPVGHTLAAAAGLVEPRERVQHARHARGIPSRARRVLTPRRSACSSSSRPYFRKSTPSAVSATPLKRPRLRHEDTEEGEADACARRLRVLLRGVTRRHVADFVTEHAGQLRLVVEERQDAARQVDVSARQRKRVHRRRIDHSEVPGQIRPFRRARETHTDIFDVPLEFGVVVNAHLPPHLGIHLLADLDFLRLAHQRELALAGRRIRGARASNVTSRQGQRRVRKSMRMPISAVEA